MRTASSFVHAPLKTVAGVNGQCIIPIGLVTPTIDQRRSWNAIGGVIFVALVKYGHIARSSMEATEGVTGGYMEIYEQEFTSRLSRHETADESG